MAELKPRQWEIDGFLMGAGTPINVYLFEPGGKPSTTSHDRDHAAGDGRVFGIDTLTGRTVSIEMSVDCDNIIDATKAYNDLAAVWHDPKTRMVEGATIALRYRPFAGLPTRVMYGRPRAFDPANEWLLEVGRVDVVASFETDDPLCWEDPELIDPITIPITPPTTGGFTAPFTAPIVVATTSSGFGEFTVGGSVPTPLVAQVHGPITNPVLDYLGQWRLQVNTTLLYDQHLTVDARPGVRSVVRSDGANLSGRLTGPPLSDLLLTPGPAEMVLRGLDGTGTSKLTLTPQAASATPYWA